MAWSPPARQRRAWLVEQTGDYAAPISHHIRDGTLHDRDHGSWSQPSLRRSRALAVAAQVSCLPPTFQADVRLDHRSSAAERAPHAVGPERLLRPTGAWGTCMGGDVQAVRRLARRGSRSPTL